VYFMGLGPAPPQMPGGPPPRGRLDEKLAAEQFKKIVQSWSNRADGTMMWQGGY